MTVSSTTVKQSYSGNGSTSAFTYSFKISSTAELKVIIRNNTTATETVKSISSHYNVNDTGSGGTVTFTSGNIPASGETVVLIRDTNLTQTTDYVENDPFPAESHESALDKLTLQTQELQEELDRAIKLSRTNTMTSTEFTVGATDRASKILAFDSSGEISVTQELGTFKGNWSSSTSYVIRDIVKDTSTNNIFIVNTAHTSSGSQPLTSNANSAKYSLLVDAASATTSATNAASSATAAASSATTATSKATEAANSATAAATSETNAATSASTASTQATNAASSATSASSSASTATTKASEASTSETNAASSATSASSSASTATTKASEASTSASNAASSASTASGHATTATTKASEAATSATNAATSATAADTAKTAAQAAQTAAEAAADNFDDTYLGAKSSDPSTDNDGDALTAGDLYFNTSSNELKVYNGSSWQVAASDVSTLATKGFSIALAVAL
jgi:hypothetical protein